MTNPAMHIHLDPLGGIAGDMFVAALLDAFPDLRAPLAAQLHSLQPPVPLHMSCESASDHSLSGTRFTLRPAGVGHDDPAAPSRLHLHAHSHDDSHGAHHHGGSDHHAHLSTGGPSHGPINEGYARPGHVPHRQIAAWLGSAPLDGNVRAIALGVFQVLAEAEAAVHGTTVGEVEFHEVGAWDSIGDIVAAAFLIDAIGVSSWSVGPLPLGAGLIRTAHGVLPVPAPATVWLTRGMPQVDDGVAGERVTPTGAAILRFLQAGRRDAGPLRTANVLTRSGLGLGTRRLPDRANALRCLVFEAIAHPDASTSPAVETIAFEIDDQSPEDLAVGLDHLREQPGVLQVMQMPVFAKKGRMGTKVEIVSTTAALEEVVRACFAQTTTLGVRLARVERRVLERSMVESRQHAGTVRVKVARRGAQSTAKAEMDDLASTGTTHMERERLRRSSESDALDGIADTREDKSA